MERHDLIQLHELLNGLRDLSENIHDKHLIDSVLDLVDEYLA